MARFVTGNEFNSGDQVTATTLNNAVNNAKVSTDSVDNSSVAVDGSGVLSVKTSTSASDGVTFAKFQQVPANTVLVRDANSQGSISAKAVADTQILIGDGTGFTSAALSGDATMTNAGAVTVSSVASGATGTTASSGDNSTKLATTAYIDAIAPKEALFVYDDTSVTTLNTDDTTFSQCPLTQSYNFITGVSVSSNNITLPAGTYIIDGIANIAITNNNQNNGAINILEKTDGTDLLRGMDVSTSNDFSTNSTRLTRIMGSLTFTESTDIRWMFRRQAAGTRAVTLGRNLGQGSAPNAYLKITKLGI